MHIHDNRHGRNTGRLKPYRERGIFKDDVFGKVDTLLTRTIKTARQKVGDAEIGIYNEVFGDSG
jgi:hypothetical protein